MTDYADLEKRLNEKARYVAAFPNAMHRQIAVPELLAEAAAALAALSRERDEAREAIRPLARQLDVGRELMDDDPPFDALPDAEPWTVCITVGDVRRAALCLSREGGKQDQGDANVPSTDGATQE